MMTLELSLILPKLRFDVNIGFVERAMSVGPVAFRFDDRSGIQMQCAVDTEERSVVAEHHAGLGAAVEMLSDHLFKPYPDTCRKRLTDLNLFT
jgi:hypothetical protein